MTGIFGELDIDSIPDDPFFTAANWYWCKVTESYMEQGEDGAGTLVIKWSIDEPTSEFHGNTMRENYDIPALPKGIKWEDLSPEEKKPLKFLKRRMRRAFDLSEKEIKTTPPSKLIGKGAFVKVVNNEGKGEHEGRTFANVRDALCKAIYEQEIKKPAESTAGTMGL